MTNAQIFILAIALVESNNDPNAYNASEDAKGILQIRPILIDDVNRILNVRDTYVHNDAYDPGKSRDIFWVYVKHYYPQKFYMGNSNFQNWARCWNGGPKGPDKAATLVYWYKVKRMIKEIKDGEITDMYNTTTD